VGRSGKDFCVLKKEDFIELPLGSDIFFLPGRKPVGLNIKTNKIEINPSGLAVAAFVAPAYTVAYSAAWETMPEAPRLPLYAYSAVGWSKKKFYDTPWHGNHAFSTLGPYNASFSGGMPGKIFSLKTKTKNIFIVCFKRDTKRLARR